MKKQSLTALWTILLLTLGLATSVTARAASFDEALQQLDSRSFNDKAAAIQTLTASGDPRTERVLQTLLDGQLYADKKTGALVKLISETPEFQVQDLFSETAANPPLRSISKRSVKRIGINNALRKDLKLGLAMLSLKSTDTDQRTAAVRSLMGELDPALRLQLQQQLQTEADDNIRDLLQVALAIDTVTSGANVSSNDVAVLGNSLEPAAKNALLTLVDNQQTAADEALVNKVPFDPRLSIQAKKALASIDQKIQWSGFAETLFFGLSLGSVLVLAAIGLAITFGVMGVINMAHGELIMLGAYTTYVVQLLMPNHIGLSILVAIPTAFMVSACVGILIERSVIRFLYGRPLETLLATFGISLILQQLVRSIFSPLNRSVSTPDWMTGSLELSPVLSLTLNRLYIIVFCLIVFALLFMLLKRTRLGLQVRAVSQNRAMARAMGVRSARVDALTFGLGSGVAGIAGVALSQLTNVGPNLGQAYIIDSFMVVVFGGVGNLWGTLVAGLSLGVANKLLEPTVGAVLAKILVLIFIILFIQKFPRGLFPQKGRSAEG